LNQRTILVSVRNTFGDAYYSFFNPTDSTAAQQSLTLPLTDALFPFSNLGTPLITDISLIAMLAEPLTSATTAALGAGISMKGTFDLTSNSTPAAITFDSVTDVTTGAAALSTTGSVTAPSAPPTSFTATNPASFTLIIPQANVPPTLQVMVNGQVRLDPSQISDIVLLIAYNIQG
jgi:hypothetical protein